jgi:hypothetical protein
MSSHYQSLFLFLGIVECVKHSPGGATDVNDKILVNENISSHDEKTRRLSTVYFENSGK